jgi:pimeloyl-ACP methyl ester carboxylesterase
MNTGCWRRLAVNFVRHAAWVMPHARSQWADAMRRELDYIADNAEALRWAVGCILASYRASLTHWLGAPVAWRHVGITGVLMILIGLALQANAQTQPPGSDFFEETNCNLPNVPPEIGPRLRCGTVSVPRSHESPDASRFKLAVVVVKSERQPAWPEPVVYISGGPGNPLTIYAGFQARTPYAPRRDLILVDQRGTGRSEPSLCPDFDRRLLEDSLALALTVSDEALTRRQATYLACRDQAIGRGLDLKDFGTRVTAEDFDRVRQALGVERWNVYGESYGTTVAMTLAALHPETIRSLVLDSIYSPDPVPLWSATVIDTRDAFFANCAQDQACSASFPDLAGTYRDTLAKLAQSPLAVTVPPRMQRPELRVMLTASLFELAVNNLLYFRPAYPTVPQIIQSVHDGETQSLGVVLASQLAAAAVQNRATYAAVECRDRAHLRKPLPVEASTIDRRLLYGICDRWSELGRPPLVPAGTRVPTLVLAGEFDPVARPAFSRHVAEQIGSSARFVQFPFVGHNVRAFAPCGAKIAADFIDQPAQPPDISCADRIAPIRFLPKQQTP